MFRRFLASFMLLVSFLAGARCEEYREAYVICQPKSFVYVRRAPKFKSQEVAYLNAGDEILTDGRVRGGWLHVFVTCESGEGWIYKGYVVYDEPFVYEDGIPARTIYRQVIVRRCVKGKILKKLKKGTELKVLVLSDEWALTDRGFVKTKYLDIDNQGGAS